jgi:hypothetical protein
VDHLLSPSFGESQLLHCIPPLPLMHSLMQSAFPMPTVNKNAPTIATNTAVTVCILCLPNSEAAFSTYGVYHKLTPMKPADFDKLTN